MSSSHDASRDVAVSYFETTPTGRATPTNALDALVGSGVVEAGCKTGIGTRLKRSGMHWTAHGATAITTLRCTHASHGHLAA